MNIEHHQRNSFTRTLTFLDETDTPIDLTGATLKFIVKDEIDSDSAAIEQDVSTFDDPTSGVVHLNVLADEFDLETGEYFYEVLLEQGGKQTVLKGVLTIIASLF